MANRTKIFIRPTPGALRPQLELGCLNEYRGGPETLFRWLETQLWLPFRAFHHTDRGTEYAVALDTLGKSAISGSMAMDRWATASELLSRRDVLLLSGWDETDGDGLPSVVRDLACSDVVLKLERASKLTADRSACVHSLRSTVPAIG